MIFRFKPEHFEHPNQLFVKDQHGVFRIMPEEASHTANRLLDAHVATLPEVFGIQDGSDNLWHFQDSKSVSPHPSTHRARLWGIEEIKPNKCEHTYIDLDLPVLTPEYVRRSDVVITCSDCGKRLVAKWEEI